MDNNGKINRGIDLGTTNSAIAVMENGAPAIKKSSTQKDTVPSVVSVTRKGIIHTGDTAANELANQVLRATKTWDGRYAATDTFKEFKRKMGTAEVYHSKNLKKDFTPQQLSAEIIKTLAANADVNDGGCIIISVPAKFDVTQKTATVEAAHLAGFQYVELLQEPIAAAIAYGVATGHQDGFWLVFDFGGGTFDAALLRVDGGVQQVVDTEGDSYLGGKDIDAALVESILIPYVKKNFKVDKILASEKKTTMLRMALNGYAESAKVQLSTAPCAEILSDLGELGCDDTGKEIELDLTITREMAYPIMEPFFKKAVTICQKILQRNHLDGNQLTKLILVGGPTYSPYLRQMLKEEVSQNVDTSVDPMTAVAKGATLYAATRDIPADLMPVPDADAIELELHYDTMSADLVAYLAIGVKDNEVMTEGMVVEVVRGDGAWESGKIPYEEGGIVVDLPLVERSANNFKVHFSNDKGHHVKVAPDNFTILQGVLVPAAPLPYHIGFGVWNDEDERQVFIPFQGLEKNKSVPARGMAIGRKTTMRIVPGDDSTFLKIPVYQASSYVTNSPADLYEHVADLMVTGKDVEHEIPAGAEVEVQVSVDSSEMMDFDIFVPLTEESIEKTLDTTPHFNSQDGGALIAQYSESARRMLDMLKNEGIAIEVLKNRLYALKISSLHTETKAIIEEYKELLRDIYCLECETAWERIIRKVEKEMALLYLAISVIDDGHSKDAFHYLEVYLESAKENRDEDAAKKILEEIELLRFDLRWKDEIPNEIKWYDRNYYNVAWEDKNHARTCINQALELIKGEFTKEELMKAYYRILNARADENEIREAGGLLG